MLTKDLDQICTIFADPLSCKQMIEEYAGQVFDYLAGQIVRNGLLPSKSVHPLWKITVGPLQGEWGFQIDWHV